MTQAPSAEKNVLFLAYEFPPRGGPGVQRSGKFAKYLPNFGYRPLVLTAAEEEIDFAIDRTLLNDLQDVTIFRCRGYERFLVRWPGRMKMHRLITFFLRPDRNVLAWVPKAMPRALQIAKEHAVNLIYVSLTPFSSALMGRRLKKILGVPLVVDFRDPWTDDSFRAWPTKFHHRYDVWQERRVLESADAIVVVTPTMKDLFVRRYPQWESKVHVIPNGFDRQDFRAAGEGSTNSRLRISHAGALLNYDRDSVGDRLGPLTRLWIAACSYRPAPLDLSTHSPYYLLHAARKLLDERPELEDKLAFCFAGVLGEQNQELVKELKLENVVSFEGYLPHAQSVRFLLDSDVLFLPMMSPTDGSRSYIYSGKVFEYLATGKPILAAVPEGDARDLIQETRSGWCVEPHDIDAMKWMLEDLIEKKMAGTLSVTPNEPRIAQFERRELTKSLAALFDSLLR